MKQTISILCLLLVAAMAQAQNITGIWRGTFYNVRDMMYGNGTKSRYEVQIDDSKKPIGGKYGVAGITYSYQSTKFYGKASLRGIWDRVSKSLIFEENKLLEYKYSDGNNIYLFNCVLDYRKEDGKEILEGTFTSKHYKTGEDGGSGRVYLEKVPDSDFELEDFLKKKAPLAKGKVKPGLEDIVVKKATRQPANTAKPPVKKPAIALAKKPAKPPLAVKKSNLELVKKPSDSLAIATPAQIKKAEQPLVVPEKPTLPPPVLKERTNELFQTITTSAHDITISFYDNGEVDGDTISVYDNNRLIAKNKGLSAKPISVTVHLNDALPEHDIIMVAENLGTIPPNTALMIVEADGERYTVNLSSTEQKNAMVKIKFAPKP